MYSRYIKRGLDILLSLTAILLLSPVFLVFTVTGIVKMKGNPFFFQKRPGLNEKIFKLIKYRTMTNEKDSQGRLLPDEKRLNAYGEMLRKTSLDELPELFNILKGDMSVIGPRPLLPEYLPWYSEEQARRHDVRPGLTGYAQAHGRNALDWDTKLELDIKYVDHITFFGDVKIIIDTVGAVIRHEGISSDTSATMENFADYCRSKGRQPRKS